MNKLGILLFLLVLAMFLSLCWWQVVRYQQAVIIKQKSQAASNSVLVRGAFDFSSQGSSYWLLDNISQKHSPGYYLLSLFLTEQQQYKLVVRDWIASSGDRQFDVENYRPPPVQSGQIEIETWQTSYIKPDPYPWNYYRQYYERHDDLPDSSSRVAIIQTIDLDKIKQDTGINSTIEVVTQIKAGDPVVVGAEQWLVPDRHLGYAMTWGLLALCWCVVWLVNIYRNSKTT